VSLTENSESAVGAARKIFTKHGTALKVSETALWVYIDTEQTVSGAFWVENHAARCSAIAELFTQSDRLCIVIHTGSCDTLVWYFSESNFRAGRERAAMAYRSTANPDC